MEVVEQKNNPKRNWVASLQWFELSDAIRQASCSIIKTK